MISTHTHVVFGAKFTVPLKLPKGALPLELYFIRPKSFMMGYSEEAQKRIDFLSWAECEQDFEFSKMFKMTLTNPFWLGRYPVTQAQWESVMKYNPSPSVKKKCSFFTVRDPRPNHPVQNISWFDALEFCEKLFDVYKHILPDNYIFSLPTEAQWEYVCKAGNSTLHLGTSVRSHPVKPLPVDEFPSNDIGFFDMTTNLFEWCYDEMSPYPKNHATDWYGKITGEITDPYRVRVIRGGSTCEDRLQSMARDSAEHFGFRLCCRPSLD